VSRCALEGLDVSRCLRVTETGDHLPMTTSADPVAPPVRPTRRRRLLVAVVLAGALVVTGAWLWLAAVPGYRPALRPGERFGVDVSNHQGEIDWPQVAADDIDFAYLKATEGGDWVDDRFAANWEAAAAAGIDRGAYHFFTFCRPGADQAANFLRTVPRDAGALAPAVDVEAGGNCVTRLSRDELRRELGAFIDAVERGTGRRVLVYLLDDVDGAGGLRDELDRPVWQREILRRPPDGWAIWQVSSRARVRGIGGPADLNVARAEPRSG
jgi:lysozyme